MINILVAGHKNPPFGEQNDINIVGQTADPAQTFELCRNLRPDLVLMNVEAESGRLDISCAAQIRRELPRIKVVITTDRPETTVTDKAWKAGIQSYYCTEKGSAGLPYVIRSTMQGHGIYPGPVH